MIILQDKNYITALVVKRVLITQTCDRNCYYTTVSLSLSKIW
jgi:hypothetical protein